MEAGAQTAPTLRREPLN